MYLCKCLNICMYIIYIYVCVCVCVCVCACVCVCRYRYRYMSHITHSDWASLVFSQSAETRLISIRHFVFEYRSRDDIEKTRKKLGYFTKQIENSFLR